MIRQVLLPGGPASNAMESLIGTHCRGWRQVQPASARRRLLIGGVSATQQGLSSGDNVDKHKSLKGRTWRASSALRSRSARSAAAASSFAWHRSTDERLICLPDLEGMMTLAQAALEFPVHADASWRSQAAFAYGATSP